MVLTCQQGFTQLSLCAQIETVKSGYNPSKQQIITGLDLNTMSR